MKVLEKGRDQNGWSTEAKCTGSGNGGGGCGAKLLVEEGDLYLTSRQSYGDTSPERFVTFRCCACGVETDIDAPNMMSKLTRVRNTRASGDVR